jgi:hypothetical protein
MALTGATKQAVIAHVGEELARRGWRLFGYTEDRSDPMTDYFAPARWDGVATHPDYPGVVVGVGVSAYRTQRSGQDEMGTRQLAGDPCPRCHGSGLDPLGWTLAAARREPARYHRERIAAEHGPDSGVQALFNTVVSPIPFDGEGRLTCVQCHGRGHQLRREQYVRWTWPVFQATPKGRMWHVERDGHIVKTGTGYGKCAGSRWDAAARQALVAVCDAIEAAARLATSPEAEEDAGEPTPYTVTYDRDWTWVRFPAKPPEAVRTALKGLGARWSRRRCAWYIRQRVEVATVQATLAAAT